MTETSRDDLVIVPVRRARAPIIGPLLVTVALLATAIAFAGSLVVAYGLRHGPTIYRGVQAAGVDLSGLTPEEAQALLDQRVATGAPIQVTLVANGQQWSVPLESLGVHYDTTATVRNAYAFGRTGSLWSDSRDWVAGLVSGREVPIVAQLDDRAALGVLRQLAPTLTREPVNARYVFDSTGKLEVAPGQPGVGIDVPATTHLIRERLSDLSTQPVTVVTVEVPPQIEARSLEAGLKQANAMVAEPLILESDGLKWEVSPETLRSFLIVESSRGSSPAVTLDADRLKSYIGSLTGQVERPGQNAGVVWRDGQFVVTPSANGSTLDVDASVAAIIDALRNGQREVSLRMRSEPAPIVEADAEPAAERAQAMVAEPLKVTWDGGEASIGPAELASAIRFREQPSDTPKLVVEVNSEALGGLLANIAQQVEVPAKDAELRYYGGQVTVVSAEQTGVKLDIEQSVAALKNALESGQRTVALVTTPVQPSVTAAMADTVVIRDLLASAETYYGGSVANRKHNVELAVERANGALIPPGGIYSFVGTVGAVDLNSGYKVGYGIVGTSNGSVSTVPSVGGGICQVSTTMFQAAFWAGMPIVERNWHLYWIPLYGQPPSGLKGLDATVDTDYGLDFKFKNTTDNWLAVQASADGSTVRFELWGTDPGWDVQVDDPVVTNVVPADTTMQYRESDQLPAGTSVLVEHAEDGFDVAIHRVVSKDGQVLDDLTLRSHYRPSANVTLVGTG